MRLFTNVIKVLLLAAVGVAVYTFIFARHPPQRSIQIPHYSLVAVQSICSGYISKAVFSQDGRLFSAIVDEKSVKQWDTRDWSEKHAFRLLGSPSSIAFSPDGALVAWQSLAGHSHTLFVQSFQSGRKFSVPTKTSLKNKIHLFFDGNTDLTVNAQEGIRTIWDTSTAFSTTTTVRSFFPPEKFVLKQFDGPCVSGQQSALTYDLNYDNDTVRVIDGCTGRTVNSFHCLQIFILPICQEMEIKLLWGHVNREPKFGTHALANFFTP